VLAAAAITVALVASTAYASGVIDGSRNPNHIPGESLDSGLGNLPPTYTAKEFDKSRDSGLRDNKVQGEKIDSGLGSVTREELSKIIASAQK